MAVTKDLGAVTAYAHAVEGGYTGTLSEFETLMASYATVAQQAAASASNAEAFGAGTRSGVPVSSGDDAYENNAVYYAGLAEDAKDDAEAAAASLVIEDEFDEDSTNALENGVITKALETKAEIDGAYETMTVGNAEQLVSTVFVNDEEPYNFRTAGGSADIGDRLYDTVIGGTVAWNQLANPSNEVYTNNGVTFTKENGAVRTSGIATGLAQTTLNWPIFTTNHVYGFWGCPPNGSSETYFLDTGANLGHDIGAGRIAKYTGETASKYLRVYAQEGTDVNGLVFKPQLFDLTAMFGSTIADYIYSLETANAGAGVAWFRKLFPKPYYAYNAGELMSVNTSAHNTVGFNLCGNADALLELGPGVTYSDADGYYFPTHYDTGASHPIFEGNEALGQLTISYKHKQSTSGNAKGYLRVVYTDGTFSAPVITGYAANTWETSTFVTDPNKTVLMVRYSYNTSGGDCWIKDICINLRWDGERDGEYEEYVKHSYPLDSDLTLRGIPKLDASNNLYYDGDVYNADGSVNRRATEYMITGNEGWQYYETDDYFYCNPALGAIKSTVSDPSTAVFVGYKQNVRMTDASGSADMSFTLNTEAHGNNNFYIRNTSFNGDLNAFKSYITGKKIVFLLETPTTEIADPFQSPQIVDDFGTEEYVDYAMSEGDRDVAIPVGHVTKYTNNLRAKLEMSPNSPDGAGDYLVRQTNGINEYVSLASNATIQDIIARLEALEGEGGE